MRTCNCGMSSTAKRKPTEVDLNQQKKVKQDNGPDSIPNNNMNAKSNSTTAAKKDSKPQPVKKLVIKNLKGMRTQVIPISHAKPFSLQCNRSYPKILKKKHGRCCIQLCRLCYTAKKQSTVWRSCTKQCKTCAHIRCHRICTTDCKKCARNTSRRKYSSSPESKMQTHSRFYKWSTLAGRTTEATWYVDSFLFCFESSDN